ncbi:Centromere/kinetochore protein zw10 [Lobosporangium transversale]|uniref:Centromere/kinetochore Zw10-domain-containing protein n=1 Tax=Lobosporangium transversale TaxID=64571 RepID=A0A1Y2GDV9_9FUNG|nr:Centromere/kinetochore Zw10-domain-containing protein [Lobosporangium transversale]KAF9918072.1 Centromere/kinetochore protein zw10 [Lobosporangium transversale]ORZ06329.1 Centromere/kinetochore Zw10-domain-containing protein [Lobosporangium transversale]|eukprot:XP_021877492.1 Centromere/kinetochore Zw10-domain-containing protein [Lobosporangium transversale]
MATSVVTGHSFARFVASHLDEQSHSISSPANVCTSTSLPATNGHNGAPVTTDELAQAIASVDVEIQAIKAQVYKKLLANYNAFSESFEYSLELKDKIDDLLQQVDSIATQTMDSETGLRQQVMSALVDHHEISYKVQESNAILDGLNHFSRINDILSEYEGYMDAGKILQAGHCIQQAAKLLAQPPSPGVAASQITKSLTDQCSKMTEAIDQMLDELVAGAIYLELPTEQNGGIFKLNLSYDVKVPTLTHYRSSSRSAPGTVRWHELIRTLMLLDVINDKLKVVQNTLIRHLLQPLIRDHGNVRLAIENSGDYASAHHSTIALIPENSNGADTLFNQIFSVFQFLYRDVFLSDYSIAEFNNRKDPSDTEKLVHFIGRNIAKKTCAMVSVDHLSKLVPTNVEELNQFGPIATAAIQFEEKLIAMGYLTADDRVLRDFVEHIDVHYTNHKRDALLKIGRAVIMSDDFKTIHVRELDRQDELEKDIHSWDSIKDPEMDLKDSSISMKSKQIVDMITSTLGEAMSLNEEASRHLYQATRSLIDLYRALMPVHHARTLGNVPALAILFFNDCMYIARELEKVPARLESGIPGLDEVQYDDVIPGLKDLAKKWLDIQVQKQLDELMQSVDEARGFRDSSVESNFAAYERSMKQVVLVFKHLGKAWKPIMSPMSFYKVLGKLLDDTIMRVIRELEGLTDISEQESHKLAALCGVLFECEDQFDHASPLVELIRGDAYEDEDPIYHFVLSWKKFQLLADILELSFAEIMTRFRAGQLYMFQVRELSNLLCALFADTPLRQRNLEEIEKGHPMPLLRS